MFDERIIAYCNVESKKGMSKPSQGGEENCDTDFLKTPKWIVGIY